jgi:hypothetical protein
LEWQERKKDKARDREQKHVDKLKDSTNIYFPDTASRALPVRLPRATGHSLPAVAGRRAGRERKPPEQLTTAV